MNRGSKWLGWIVIIIALVLWRQFGPGLPVNVMSGDEAIAQAFADHRTDLMVEFTGRVQRTLNDELTGRPQQRFIVELDNGHLLLVSHDLEYAERVPLDTWDTVSIRGEYQWNEQGGMVSWTHRDPGIGLRHGWIDFKGRRYQ
jgi:hypothetical protein